MAKAETHTEGLSPFEGKEVTEVGVEMPNAAGGLQDAMRFEPVEWEQGEEHFIVLQTECKTGKARGGPTVRERSEAWLLIFECST